MTGPLAYHLTWTTYGSWLPGDDRGWVDLDGRIREPDQRLNDTARHAMSYDPVALTPEQREVVDATIHRHSDFRRWELHALHVGEVHVHVVVTADKLPDVVVSEFKSWCSRRLNEVYGKRPKWWTEGGSTKWVNDEHYLSEVITYVSEGQ